VPLSRHALKVGLAFIWGQFLLACLLYLFFTVGNAYMVVKVRTVPGTSIEGGISMIV
jgi:hypothetical protein